MRTLVILGTGTEVGKTYVSCALLDLLSSCVEVPVIGLKPVESGVTDLVHSDAGILATHSRPRLTPRHAIALARPVSPHLAARLEGRELTVQSAVWWTEQAVNSLSGHSDDTWLIIETAGGVFSPINERETNADLAAAFDPSTWVLVAPDRLGVLHDMTATLKALSLTGRRPDLILLNAPPVPDSSTGTNRSELERLGIATVTAVISRNQGLTECDRMRLLTSLGL